MTVEQLLNSKSKEEAAFLLYEERSKVSCLKCRFFRENEYGVWQCGDKWQKHVCRGLWEKFLANSVQEEIEKEKQDYARCG